MFCFIYCVTYSKTVKKYIFNLSFIIGATKKKYYLTLQSFKLMYYWHSIQYTLNTFTPCRSMYVWLMVPDVSALTIISNKSKCIRVIPVIVQINSDGLMCKGWNFLIWYIFILSVSSWTGIPLWITIYKT